MNWKKLNPFRSVTVSEARQKLLAHARAQTKHHQLEALRKRYESAMLLSEAQAHEAQVDRLLALRSEMTEDEHVEQK